MSIERFDDKLIYCKRLGHELKFKYCRTTDFNVLCKSIKDCWHNKIDIISFLNENYSEKELAKIESHTPPPPKMMSIFEIMKKAQERVDEA